MSPNDVAERLAGLRADFDRSFAEPARRHDEEYAELLAVHAGGRPYALRLSQASGLHQDRAVTPLPGPQPALLGVAGFGGAIVPVYDLAALLGHAVPDRPRWLVLTAGAPALALAFHQLDGHVRVTAAEIVEEPGADGGDILRGMVPLAGGTRPIVDLPAARAAVHRLAGHTEHAEKER
ncbi:chemotaxis protein CheW [Couchioplanes caeruleus]|uniref:Chemotaxis protein CheW n=2 Tax=Couchioplanes caeruleus TaxID=56438 RepID=A0A1K0FMI6_9ACTN|nr:chemotaxis protein CheW [Couchioplanes caeruleus]OJF14009.1 chemotaxis protein CheW [Couchioplanes caeruleus subsp. caeruleus]ROP34342.1 purine-binding chemotaxis protein CheW [Couchioplanes caeruleus]